MGFASRTNLLATFGHERKAAVLFLGPMAAHIGMSKVPIPDGLDMDYIDKLSKFSRAYNLSKGGIVG